MFRLFIYFFRTMVRREVHYGTQRGIATGSRLSMTLRYHDHRLEYFNNDFMVSQLGVFGVCTLKTQHMDLLQMEHLKILAGIGVGYWGGVWKKWLLVYKSCDTSEMRQDKTKFTIKDQQEVAYVLVVDK